MALHFLPASLAHPSTFPSELPVQEGLVLTAGAAKYLTAMFLVVAAEGISLGQGLDSFHQLHQQIRPPNPTNWGFNTSQHQHNDNPNPAPNVTNCAAKISPELFLLISVSSVHHSPRLCSVSTLLVLSCLGMQWVFKYLTVINKTGFLLQKVGRLVSRHMTGYLKMILC